MPSAEEVLQERTQLVEEAKSIEERMRAAGINFIFCLDLGETLSEHNLSVAINMPDNHHVMDGVCAIGECWWKANHKKKE